MCQNLKNLPEVPEKPSYTRSYEGFSINQEGFINACIIKSFLPKDNSLEEAGLKEIPVFHTQIFSSSGFSLDSR